MFSVGSGILESPEEDSQEGFRMRRKMVMNKRPESHMRMRAAESVRRPPKLPETTDLSWIDSLARRWFEEPEELLWLAS